jgi:hypothetical protein
VPTKTWVVGEEVLAADFNAMVQKQVVATFANAAARTAAIPAPTPGMLSYLNDTGKVEQYTDKAAAAGWYPPWAQPWGRISDKDVSDLLFTTGLIVPGSGFSLPVANRRYVITWTGNLIKANDQVGTINMTVEPGGGLPIYVQGVWSLNPNFRTRGIMAEMVTSSATLTGGVVTASCDAGQCTLNWQRISVDDMGPA